MRDILKLARTYFQKNFRIRFRALRAEYRPLFFFAAPAGAGGEKYSKNLIENGKIFIYINMFNNKGRGLIGIIIVLVVVGLISGGLYYYLEKQTPEVS